ncbi:histone-like nucleoid-structuring protein, MvaT/MvaU family [Pseudomonas sp. LS-2]|jgi:hypothetical protein|uniref:histone-like nucleoid-structuring protein, MvaT/MvaU family n=1 Tax=Pseudomonas sp. LS-2 TaxID=2315859 RepID=UPI000E76D5CB|nr:histone-like nucleoid-structuring protein, MvaT/MvaU family [Pseudomonas sp. LS-2]RJX82580.1 transcriptional regulator [Pseudomonas sp. LS-2]
MSRLAEYRKLEQQIAQHAAQLESFKHDPALQREIEFETRLKALLEGYGKRLSDVISLLEPNKASVKGKASEPVRGSRRPRQVKTYRNPLTGEIVESKGGNNKLLGAWKAQFGHEEVESWVTPA